MPDFILQLLYKSSCSVWYNNAFMSRLAVVIMHCPEFVQKFVIAYSNKYQLPTITFPLLPCQCQKSGYCPKTIDRNGIHLVQWASMVISRLPRILHLRKVSRLFVVLLSLIFTCLGKNNVTSCALTVVRKCSGLLVDIVTGSFTYTADRVLFLPPIMLYVI